MTRKQASTGPKLWAKLLLAILGGLIIWNLTIGLPGKRGFHTAADDTAGQSWLYDKGFEDFRRGQATDSGANLYVSAQGRIQTINRWDLNLDGELDLLFTADHNHVYTPDSLIYWGSGEGFESLVPDFWQQRSFFSLLTHLEQASSRVSRLPTQGGGRARIADFNRDGFSDIVFCNTLHNYRPDQPAYIYWGGPAGFSSKHRTDLPAYQASGIAVADLNGDGFPEIVIANRGHEYGDNWGYRLNLESYIYWGSASGYGPEQRTSVKTVSAADVAIGDFNGDQFLDLAFINQNREEMSVYIYWGNSDAQYSETQRQVITRAQLGLSEGPGNSRTGMQTLCAIQLNHHTYADLVIAGIEYSLVCMGSADGLRTSQAIRLPVDHCRAMEAADLNGDGQIDLVFANEGSKTSTIYWGSSDGYQTQKRTELPTLAATTVQVADLNGDRYPDLLFGNSRDQTTTSPSTDVPSYIYWGGARGYVPYRRSQLFGFGTVGSGIADFNQDGKLDILLVSHLSGQEQIPATIYWGNSDHYYGTASATFLEDSAQMEYSTADLDDDGYPDLVLMHLPGIQVWWGSAKGFDVKNRTQLPVENPMSNSVADLNKDGYLDILVGIPAREGERGATERIIWGNSRRFQQAQTLDLKLSGRAIESSAIADLNKDGYLDLILPLGGVDFSEIMWGSANGFREDATTKLDAYGAPHVAVADLDADGWLDLIFTGGFSPSLYSADGGAVIYWGGSYGYSSSSRTRLENFTGLDATIADFNRDGHLDIVLSNYRSDTQRDLPAFLYWGDGTRRFSSLRRSVLPGTSTSAVDALDLNRDGWPDLVVSNHQTHFDHAAGTNIYWGDAAGFSAHRHTYLPTIGIHLDAMVDAGNIYDRRYAWEFVSRPLELPAGKQVQSLHWKAETKLGTSIEFQVRSSLTQEALVKAPWIGPEGKNSTYRTSGMSLGGIPKEHRWLQYRAIMKSPDGGNSATLSEVGMKCH